MGSVHIDNSTLYAAFGCGAGVYFFFTGFRDLKSKRTIENIPTSKIATGAVGSDVEVKGRVVCEKEKIITAPISRIPCALYSIEVQVLKRNKNNTYWAHLDQFFSDEGFWIDDQSGANAMILVQGAKITRKGNPAEYRARSNSFDEMPDTLRNSLDSNRKKLRKFKYKDTSWLFSQQYRFLEWCFFPGEQIYVLGFAESGFKAPKKKKIKMASFLKAKKLIAADPKLQKRFDRNQDGTLDPNEMEHAAKVVAQKLEEKYSKEKVDELLPKTRMIFKKKSNHEFHISNLPEAELVKKLQGLSLLKIWGGPALTIGCLVMLLFQFGIL